MRIVAAVCFCVRCNTIALQEDDAGQMARRVATVMYECRCEWSRGASRDPRSNGLCLSRGWLAVTVTAPTAEHRIGPRPQASHHIGNSQKHARAKGPWNATKCADVFARFRTHLCSQCWGATRALKRSLLTSVTESIHVPETRRCRR